MENKIKYTKDEKIIIETIEKIISKLTEHKKFWNKVITKYKVNEKDNKSIRTKNNIT